MLWFDFVYLDTMKTSLLFFAPDKYAKSILNQLQVLTEVFQIKLSPNQVVILQYIVSFVLCFCTELSFLCNLLFTSLLWYSKLCCLVLEGTNKLTFVFHSAHSSNPGFTSYYARVYFTRTQVQIHFKLPVVLQKILLEKTEIVLSSF